MRTCISATLVGKHRRGPYLEAANRNDAFKDQVRTVEIAARQKMNQER